MGGHQVIVAGIGCRSGASAADIVALVHRAGMAVDLLAAPEAKAASPALRDAAAMLGVPLQPVGFAALEAVQHLCVSRSARVARATGLFSVAEAAALAGGGVLVLPRIANARATCALARRP